MVDQMEQVEDQGLQVTGNDGTELVPVVGGGIVGAHEPYPWDEEPIAVGNLLSNLSMEDLTELAPFYVTNIRYENTDFANAVERDGEKVVYLFDVLDGDTQEFYGTAKCATRGIIQQIDEWINYAIRAYHDTPERARRRKFGPVSAGRPMTKARENAPARPSKSVKFMAPKFTARVQETPTPKRSKTAASD